MGKTTSILVLGAAVLPTWLAGSKAEAQESPMGTCYSCGSTTPEPNTLPSEDGPTNQRDVNNQQHLQNQWNQSQQQIYQQQVDQTRRNGGSAYGRPASRGPAPRQADSDIARSPQLKVMPFGQKSPGDRKADEMTARADYAGAVRVWRPLAEGGDVNAQYAMGIMYQLGRGAPRSEAQAANWYRRAAEHGYGAAMVNLAWVIVQGARNPAELVPAYTWVRIAEAHDRDPGVIQNARYDISLLTRQMNAEQLSQAEAAAWAWRPH